MGLWCCILVGHSHWKVLGDVQPSRPLFQVILLAPETCHFQHQRPHFFFFLMHFEAQFLLNFCSWDTNFSENLFPRPQFQARKISFGDPTFENLGGTYLPKNLSSIPGLYLVPMYRFWGLLSISIRIFCKITKNFNVTSLWRHIQIGKKKKKIKKRGGETWQNLCLTMNILGTSKFHWVCGKSFLEGIDKHKNESFWYELF